MRRTDQKGRSIRINTDKCHGKVYDDVSRAYAALLEKDASVAHYETCVPLVGMAEDWMSDFLITERDETKKVRECLTRNGLMRTNTCKRLALARKYWMEQGAEWGIVLNEE